MSITSPDDLHEHVNRDQSGRTISIHQVAADDGGGKEGSALEGAEYLYDDIAQVLKLTRMDIEDVEPIVLDVRDAPIPHPQNRAHYLREIVQAMTPAAKNVYNDIMAGKKVLSLGGNHVRAFDVLGVMRACHEMDVPFGMIWIDAHPDFNTTKSTETGHVHGMPAAAVHGHGPKQLLDLLKGAPGIDPTNFMYVGLNAIDDKKGRNHTELKYLKELKEMGAKVKIFTQSHLKTTKKEGLVPEDVKQAAFELAQRIKAKGGKMAVEWDVDVVDEVDMPAQIMKNKDDNGMSGDQIKDFFNYVGSHCDIDMVGVSELDPKQDIDEKSKKLVIEGVAMLYGISNPTYGDHMNSEHGHEQKHVSFAKSAKIGVKESQPQVKSRSEKRRHLKWLDFVAGIAAGIGAVIAGQQLFRPSSVSSHHSQITSVSGEQYLNQKRDMMYSFVKKDVRQQIESYKLAQDDPNEHKEYVALLKKVRDAEAIAPNKGDRSDVFRYLLSELSDTLGHQRGTEVWQRIMNQA